MRKVLKTLNTIIGIYKIIKNKVDKIGLITPKCQFKMITFRRITIILKIVK